MMNGLVWFSLVPHAHHLVGWIPQFLDAQDRRSAREQFNERYAHGGGWRPISGFRMDPRRRLVFPGDPPYEPVAVTLLKNGEQVIIYEHEVVAILQEDGSFEACRMD